MKKLLLMFVVALSMVFLVNTVHAALVTGEFSGTISSVLDPSGLLGDSGITPGSSTFTGTFSYDSSTLPDGAGGYNNISVFCIIDGIAEFTVNAPEDQAIVMHTDNANGSDFLLFTDTTERLTVALSTYLLNKIEVSLSNENGISLASAGAPISIEEATANELEIFINKITEDQSGYSIKGIVTSLKVVPVPGAVWLLASGLLGLIGVRRKFKK